MKTFVLIACMLAFVAPLRAQQTVSYTLTFSSTWSATTHPADFPPNPHYSPLRGVTHNSDVSFWEVGNFASDGIKQMAETGNNSTLNAEIAVAKAALDAQNDIAAAGLSPSPGQLVTSFEVSTSHPLVSVVTMIAPSPDWFVGLSGVNLFANDVWVSDTTFTLYAFDAGTDDGPSYVSPNDASSPPTTIYQIPDGPFLVGSVVEAVGTIRFERETVLSNEPPVESELPRIVSTLYPNPTVDELHFEVNLSSEREVEIILFDLLGRALETVQSGRMTAGRSRFTVDTSALPAGMYLMRIVADEDSSAQAFSVVR